MQADNFGDRNKTTFNLNGSGPYSNYINCGYCDGKRITESGTEEDLRYSFMKCNTAKLRMDDYEYLFDRGFKLSGTKLIMYDHINCCCERHQHFNKASDFFLNKNQKQAMNRFHRYLATGSVNVVVQQEEEKKEEVKTNQDQPEIVAMVKAKIEETLAEHLTEESILRH